MKKLVLVIACIFAISTSKAQDSVVYKSVLGDSITEWYNLTAYSGVWAETGRYTVITGDTAMMGDTIYHVYECDEDFGTCDNFICIPDKLDNINNYTKYIRESEDRSKLYFRTSESNNEMLIMDLNLEVGDTVDTETWKWDGINYTDSKIIVDSVYYYDGRKHIRTNCYISFSYDYRFTYYDTLQFVEGVGPTFGIMYVPCLMLPRHEWFMLSLTCYYRNNILEYDRVSNSHPYYDCNIFWSIGINEVDDINVALFPNPTKDKFHITDLMNEEYTIQIISPIGAVIKTIKTLGPEIEIDLNGLPNGVYNIKISNSNGTITQKIIKL